MSNSFIEWIKRVARFFLRAPSVIFDSIYDNGRFIKYSSVIYVRNDRTQLQAVIIRKAHNIEKGLSVPNPRPLFGFDQLRDLMKYTRRYIHIYGEDEVTDIVCNAVREYLSFSSDQRVYDPFLQELADFADAGRRSAVQIGGTKLYRNQDEALDAGTLLRFLRDRTSVRNYREEPIPEDILQRAVACAAHAPAVCNRQFARVWYSSDRHKIDRMLTTQGGARGFKDVVPTILMVTADLAAYTGDERYQAWIDGGLFSMNLILGLYAQGVSSCCLNWSKDRHLDRQMRRIVPIGNSETIIMLISCGYAQDGAHVPISTRKSSDYFLNHIP